METKAQIRQHMRAWRAALEPDTARSWSELICFHLRSHERFARARTLHSFWPMTGRGEVDIRPVLRDWVDGGRTVWLPAVRGSRLEHGLLTTEADLLPAEFGQLEPGGDLEASVQPDLVLVPALAVDEQGWRIGYGGGFYDRFLRGQQGFRVGVVFAGQVLPSLPLEEHDEPLDAIVTEKGWQIVPARDP
ncbi:MAG: 5-formyltetrahydrofolate cyclo-ligase [Bacteroidetes bacterium]|nr:5-formyltetrahydrofolate cyclo-ligase [Bacteroidota bacterium]MDA0875256.1 5-formyltetrahydrofolate cyclo-ligase [Bacteroidota bacterium]